jgi:hypothetical protein
MYCEMLLHASSHLRMFIECIISFYLCYCSNLTDEEMILVKLSNSPLVLDNHHVKGSCEHVSDMSGYEPLSL